MAKCILATAKEIAKWIFENREDLPVVEFYEEERFGDYESAHRLEVIQFASAKMVIGNYYGGGAAFCYDLTADDSYEDLAAALQEHFEYLCNTDGVYWEKDRLEMQTTATNIFVKY